MWEDLTARNTDDFTGDDPENDTDAPVSGVEGIDLFAQRAANDVEPESKKTPTEDEIKYGKVQARVDALGVTSEELAHEEDKRRTTIAAEVLRELGMADLKTEDGNAVDQFIDALEKDDRTTVKELIRAEVAKVMGSDALGRSEERDMARTIKIEKLATIDDLTGIPNRRTIETELDKRYQANVHLPDRRERSENSEFTFFLFDIDHFKRINDTYGHAAGDYVLKKIGEILKRPNLLRSRDAVGRWGGEEFAVIASCPPENAYRLAERLRQAIEQEKFIFDDNRIKVTVSMGIMSSEAAIAEGVATSKALYKKADQALYRAKQGGRNQVWSVAGDDFERYVIPTSGGDHHELRGLN